MFQAKPGLHDSDPQQETKTINNMPNRMNRSIRTGESWKKYQSILQRKNASRKLRSSILKYSSGLTLLSIMIYGLAVGFSGTACQQIFATSVILSNSPKEKPEQEESALLTKKDVQGYIGDVDLLGLDRTSFTVHVDNRAYLVETTLDPSLQQFLTDRLDTKYARNIGIVLMDPKTGKIHALSGFDRTGAKKNPCTEGLFPAASIFKIVTAVAGIEKCGFSTGSRFDFNGGKHTLYKSQLKDQKNRYTHQISFQDSFAQSVNPVFGKIGANYLGRDALVDYAESFGFNRAIDFELPMSSSQLNVTDRSYQWAEVASGFNRETVMTPLHGALISAAIVNNGGLVEPTIIERIRNENGEIVYTNEPRIISYVATAGASKAVYEMMCATVRNGTSRKAFRGAGRDKILSRLEIGGKTGSIGSREIANVRYDWFVGFAQEKKGTEQLVVSVVVAHEKYIGKRSTYYARSAIKQYFQHLFDKEQREMHTRNTSKGKKDKTV
ncbi:MAG: PbpA [Desulfobacteraceae bacterium]|nr:MAG: PbpA [Desulfobacteraceae bacterium]